MEADEFIEEQQPKTESLKSSAPPSLSSVESAGGKQKQAADQNPPPRSPDMVYPGSGAPNLDNDKPGSSRTTSELVTSAGDNASTKTSNSNGTGKKSSKDDDEAAEQEDTVSLLSTSSKSLRFSGGGGSGFGGSWRGKIVPSPSGPTVDSGKKGSGTGSTSRSSNSRSRRTSNATLSEDEAAGLGTEVNLAMQDANKEGGSWGFGDEVRMGLE